MPKPTLRSRITGKIRDYRRQDEHILKKYPEQNVGLRVMTTEEGLELVQKLGKMCPMCDCKMKFRGYQPWCLYQFTFDRIDNKKIHDPTNLRLSCYSCNAAGCVTPKIGCVKKCHEPEINRGDEWQLARWKMKKIVSTVLAGKMVDMKLLPRSRARVNSRHRYIPIVPKFVNKTKPKLCVLL